MKLHVVCVASLGTALFCTYLGSDGLGVVLYFRPTSFCAFGGVRGGVLKRKRVNAGNDVVDV